MCCERGVMERTQDSEGINTWGEGTRGKGVVRGGVMIACVKEVLARQSE